MKNALKQSKLILVVLLSLSLDGCATPPTKCRVQAPLLTPTEITEGIILNDNDIASLTIYIEALENCVAD